MKEFALTIIETLSKSVTVKANNYDEALEKIEDMYDKGEIVLDSSDFKGKIIE